MTVKIGIGECVITPPVGVALAGYFPRKSHSIGVHDDLHARAVVFSDGQVHAAIAVLDLVAVTSEIVKKTRELVADCTPIPGSNLIISAIHTHSGPGPGKHLKGFNEGFDHYLAALPYYIAGLVYSVFLHRKEYKIFGSAKQGVVIGHHRRLWDKASEFIDDELTVLELKDVSGNSTAGLLYNIGCHPVKMNPDNFYITADFPAFTHQALKSVYGDKCVTVFFQAPCGNINPWNQPFTNPPSTFDDCQQLGYMLAGDVMSAIGKSSEIANITRLSAGECTVKIPLEPGLAGSQDPDDYIKVKVQAILLGQEIAIIGVPGEMFSKFGRIIKDKIDVKYCIVQELVGNDLVDEDRIAYIPTREAMHARDDEHPYGGYEVAAAVPNPETGYIIADAAVDLARTIIQKNSP
ncbi:MAG: neutral/alkaline non-lysosomal ceramidase N-terminal domain-containing protein [Promethearchaeota archaeon]